MAQTCYRHPDRETGVSCSNCARPICTDCMTTTSVGMRCPECARERTRVTAGAVFGRSTRLPATYTLIGLNVLAFIGELAGGVGGFSAGGKVIDNFGLTGPAVARGAWDRILTAGLLHAGPLHLRVIVRPLSVPGRP